MLHLLPIKAFASFAAWFPKIVLWGCDEALAAFKALIVDVQFECVYIGVRTYGFRHLHRYLRTIVHIVTE